MFNSLAGLLFPRACLSCRAPRVDGWCDACIRQIPWIRDACARCGRPAPAPAAGCSACARERNAYDTVRAPAAYAGVVRDAIMTFKIGGERRAARTLVRAMLDVAPRDATVVTFVPATPGAMRARGFNPAHELARHVARGLGVRCVPLLRKLRDTADQAGLTREQRRANLTSAFVARAAGSPVLLIDDILTTGATADACARALRAAEIERIGVLTAARAL